MVKGEDRLKEKLADYLRAPGVTVREALDEVPDPVRFTLRYGAEHYSDGVLADVDRLKNEGFELIKLKNLWHADQYKGINSSGAGRRAAAASRCSFIHLKAWRPRNSPMRRTSASAQTRRCRSTNKISSKKESLKSSNNE